MAKRKYPDLKTLVEEDEQIETVAEQTEPRKVIDNTSPEWSDYVMSLFVEDELQDGKPRVHGLRRVAKILFGQIEKTYASIVDTPTEANGRRYVASYEICFNKNRYEDVGDCSLDEGSNSFAKYPAALATTRAEARAYRKLLGIVTCAAEEISNTEVVEQNWTPDTEKDLITSQQINYINNICKKLKINVSKFVAQYTTDIKLSTKEQAEQMISDVNRYMQEDYDVPQELKEK